MRWSYFMLPAALLSTRKQMPNKPQPQDQAIAQPTKRFFVSMLTRDIDLKDAILDLVDNCLDGALRSADGAEVDYSRHRISITINANRFAIADNCGGIPRNIARDYAFKMGRELSDDRDSDTKTIGMYGIGMKRAIFKMGREAVVRSFHEDDRFRVPISSAWLDLQEWSPLPMEDDSGPDQMAEPGTEIVVQELAPHVARQFGSESFCAELNTALGEHFSTFLQKGLSIAVNTVAVDAVLIEVLVSDEPNDPAPFAYCKTIDGVEVSIVVGLNAAPKDDEADLDDPIENDFAGDRSSSTAGWSVFCNDRAVIVGDKSRLTGWGDGVPNYHAQFAIITAMIEFRSADADKLPVTSTKRALDTSSPVWLEAKTKMREALKVWTQYTNTWKNHPRSAQAPYWRNAQPMALMPARNAVLARAGAAKADGSLEFNPVKKNVLPKPPGRMPSSRRIVFARPLEEIRTLAERLFDSADEKPGAVGDRCFEIVLSDEALR